MVREPEGEEPEWGWCGRAVPSRTFTVTLQWLPEANWQLERKGPRSGVGRHAECGLGASTLRRPSLASYPPDCTYLPDGTISESKVEWIRVMGHVKA